MASIDSMVLVIAKNQLKQNRIFFFGISEKYSFKGRRLTKLTNHLLVNVAKYFEREAKKPRAVRTLLRKHRKHQDTFKCQHNISRHRGFHLKGIKNEVGVRYPCADPLVDMLCEGHGYKLELEDTMAGAVDNNSHSIVSEKSKADYVCWIITQGKNCQ